MRTVKLTERDLTRLVNKILNEQETATGGSSFMTDENKNALRMDELNGRLKFIKQELNKSNDINNLKQVVGRYLDDLIKSTDRY
jgi:hypothetical protein